MDYLKCKFMRAGLKRMPAVKPVEICDKISPYLVLCDLLLGETQILFPEGGHRNRWFDGLPGKENTYFTGIPCRSVTGIKEGREAASFLLRSGHVFIFSLSSPLREKANIYRYGERFYLWRSLGKPGGVYDQFSVLCVKR